MFTLLGNAQQNKELKADRNYADYAYIDAIAIYTKLANKGYKSENMLRKLGNAYYFSANYPEAAKWYGQLLEINEVAEPEIYFRYSNSLKSIGETEKADQYMKKFNQLNKSDSRAIRFNNNPNYLKTIEQEKDKFTIGTVNFNSSYSDFGVAFWQNDLIFGSNRPERLAHVKLSSWDGQPLSALFYTNNDKVKSFKNLTAKFNISTPVFTKDNNTVYFTQNNVVDNKRAFSDDNSTLLKIYKAEFVNGNWTNVEELPFNSNNYSCAHPALSADEKTLYFASDMPGSIGDSDIFKVSILPNGSYGKPENLGAKINTEAKESFPFLASNNEFFFSSNGHLGLGGLDVFRLKLDESDAVVENIGEPINSAFDDFAIFINNDLKTGYFSSNRPGGVGFDDIYAITDIYRAPKIIPYTQSFSGMVTDRLLEKPIGNVKITIFDSQFNPLDHTFTSANGTYKLPEISGEPGQVVYIRAEHEDYITNEQRVMLPEESGETKVDIKLDQRIVQVGRGDDLAKVFEIDNVIYFDYDKSDIRQDAVVELAKVYEVLSQYPKMKIDVRSHTDSRGSDAYNQKLSDQRANGTVNWLVKEGINKNRLSGRGYGETRLVNGCSDGVECTEEQHQKNRRSEFIITDL